MELISGVWRAMQLSAVAIAFLFIFCFGLLSIVGIFTKIERKTKVGAYIFLIATIWVAVIILILVGGL